MSLPTLAQRISILLVSVLLVSCLGTEAKNLGKKSSGGNGTGETDSESFSITTAYRQDTAPDDGRLVVLQGVRNLSSAALANLCGTTGATCQCYFYTSSSDTSPVASSTTDNGISTTNNSMSCTIPGAVDPDNYTKVRIKTLDGVKSTGFINITTTLTLGDVIGDLDTTKVRGILRYGCARTFFEGEGVSATNVNCPVSQKLGLITATYNYYLYNSGAGGNLGKKGSNVAYEAAICEHQFTKLSCDGTPSLQWGLYAEKTGIFTVGITMTANAVDTDATAIYGYASLPDTKGNCPTGLVKVRPWVAQPQSIVQGSINGLNPPSSFVNQSNNLNNTVVEISQPTTFNVYRQPNSTPCDASTGTCANVGFGGSVQVQAVAYTSITPVVCAIPKELLTGLF